MQNNHIKYTIIEYSDRYNVELSFIQDLFDRGLIDLEKTKEQFYILEDQLPHLEHLTRLHSDFSLNADSLEIIEELLSKIKTMQDQMRLLESKVSLLKDVN